MVSVSVPTLSLTFRTVPGVTPAGDVFEREHLLPKLAACRVSLRVPSTFSPHVVT